MNFEEWYNENTGPYWCDPYLSDSDNIVEAASVIAWSACKKECIAILKGKEDFIGSGIKTAIKEIEKL